MMETPRYKVVELQGYAVTAGGTAGNARPLLSVSVLDTAHCHEEVARFNEEAVLARSGLGRIISGELRRRLIRAKAAWVAAALEQGRKVPARERWLA